MMKQLVVILVLVNIMSLSAKVPTPPDGMRWVLNAQYSDEFDGTGLDRTKWNNTFDGWQGRKPAMFNPDAISVADGNLKIRSGVLATPTNGYTIYGGAVQSTTTNAHFGYYECCFKASKVPMSTTFWLSNPKAALENDAQKCSSGSYPKYSQELDIQECVGHITSTADWTQTFDQAMHSNTHFRIIKCGENKETFYSRGANKTISSKVYSTYNTYGCWWVDSKHATFYANDAEFESVDFMTDYTDTPFERPMRINMVTETYDWNPCTKADHGTALEDASVNTSYYDWIRSWYLLDVNDSLAFEGEMPLDDRIAFHRPPGFYDSSRILKLRYEYEAKKDRLLKIKIVDNAGQVVELINKKVFAGYGRVKFEEIQTTSNFGGNNPYKVVVDMCDMDSQQMLSSVEASLGDVVASIADYSSPLAKVYLNESKHLCCEGIKVETELKLFDLNGVLLLNKKIDASRRIDISAFHQGLYLISVADVVTKIML